MTVIVPATSANMGPGFDSLGVALKFYNKVEISPSTFFSVSVRGEGARFLKTKNGNAFLNVFYKTYTRLTGAEDTFRFRFENNIPLSRGLGSSSAAIVSALTAARLAAKAPIDKREILSEALTYESHPDNIAPATFGGFCVCALSDKNVVFSRVCLDDDLRAVITIPNKSISTRFSRSALPKKMKLEDAAFNIAHSSLLTAALITKDYDLLRVACADRLHQTVRMRMLPQLFDVQKIAFESGALSATLSGSGSSFFSLAENDAAAQKIAAKLRDKFPAFRTEIFEFDALGARAQES
ncbi:MAG: homoserine kinase [Helicobacteraceae bacterium]|nr:homoserine kinase [Helicobacteraceae bacterium]